MREVHIRTDRHISKDVCFPVCRTGPRNSWPRIVNLDVVDLGVCSADSIYRENPIIDGYLGGCLNELLRRCALERVDNGLPFNADHMHAVIRWLISDADRDAINSIWQGVLPRSRDVNPRRG